MQKSAFHKTQPRHITLNAAFFPPHLQTIGQFIDACKLICMSLVSHTIAEHYQIVHVGVWFALCHACSHARTHHAQHEQEHQSPCIAAFDAQFSSPTTKTLLDAIEMRAHAIEIQAWSEKGFHKNTCAESGDL